MRNKKGMLFIIDVLIGISIIFIGFLFFISFYYQTNISTSSKFASEDYVNLLTTAKLSDFKSDYVLNLINSYNLSENDNLGFLISNICYDNKFYDFNILINESLFKLSKDSEINFEVNVYYLNESPTGCNYSNFYRSLESSSNVYSSRSLIMSYNKSFDLNSYILEVKSW